MQKKVIVTDVIFHVTVTGSLTSEIILIPPSPSISSKNPNENHVVWILFLKNPLHFPSSLHQHCPVLDLDLRSLIQVLTKSFTGSSASISTPFHHECCCLNIFLKYKSDQITFYLKTIPKG